MVLSRCCFEENGIETYQDLQRTCLAIVLRTKFFLFVNFVFTVVTVVYVTRYYSQVTRLIFSASVQRRKENFLGYIGFSWKVFLRNISNSTLVIECATLWQKV